MCADNDDDYCIYGWKLLRFMYTPQQIADIIRMQEAGLLTNRNVEILLDLLLFTKWDAKETAKIHNLLVDSSLTESWIVEAVAATPTNIIADIRNGKTNAINVVIKELMKISKGKADMKDVYKRIADIINQQV